MLCCSPRVEQLWQHCVPLGCCRAALIDLVPFKFCDTVDPAVCCTAPTRRRSHFVVQWRLCCPVPMSSTALTTLCPPWILPWGRKNCVLIDLVPCIGCCVRSLLCAHVNKWYLMYICKGHTDVCARVTTKLQASASRPISLGH